jgi:hypothetical protein
VYTAFVIVGKHLLKAMVNTEIVITLQAGQCETVNMYFPWKPNVKLVSALLGVRFSQWRLCTVLSSRI